MINGSWWKELLAILKLSRPHFLLAGILLNLLGTTIAVYSGATFNLSVFLLGQIAITFTQLMTHCVNEYYDLEADRANLTPTNWSGGSRVLVTGELSPNVALNIAIGFATLAVIANIILSVMIAPHIVTFILLTTAQLLSWFYSAPPIHLHSRGLGELSATLTVTALTPIAAYFFQIHTIDQKIILAIVPLCFLQFAMLMAIEFPDEMGDRAVGKHTLVVRFGAKASVVLYCGALISAFVSMPLLIIAGYPEEVSIMQMMLFPLAVLLLWKVRRGDWYTPTRWNNFAFQSILLLVSMMLVQFVGFVLLIGFR